jgi:hypothetical protein
MLDYPWFIQHLHSLSRQRINTLVRSSGLTVHRRKGEWVFRDSRGRELATEDAFDTLVNTAQSRERMEWDYAYAARAEQEWREWQQEERRSSVAKILKSCHFLTKELGYSQPFELPATLDDVWIVAYRNGDAERQIELSGRPSESFHCEVRRMIDGVPGAYGDESFGDWEIRHFREPVSEDSGSVPAGDAALAQIVATLKRHRDLLTGEQWLNREALDAAFEDDMRRRGLLPEPGAPPPSSTVEEETRRFLTEELGFVITYDSTALSPHEREMGETFRFQRGETTVELLHTDNRVPDEWSLLIDGEVVARTLDDIAPALARLRPQSPRVG